MEKGNKLSKVKKKVVMREVNRWCFERGTQSYCEWSSM